MLPSGGQRPAQIWGDGGPLAAACMELTGRESGRAIRSASSGAARLEAHDGAAGKACQGPPKVIPKRAGRHEAGGGASKVPAR